VDHPGREGSYARLEIEDNGAGMNEATRERIFDPFFTTKPVDKGTGLGLSTVYGIVQQHGGWIECASKEGCGSVFTAYFPLCASEDNLRKPAPKVAKASGGETILVVDDEEIVRDSTRRLLEHSGYRVLLAEGTEVVELAQVEQIDLILLDLSMPDISGTEVLAQMRREEVDVPVVLFTGYFAESGQFEGVDGVLLKPFSSDQLMQQVRQVLDR
jgi:CheY-like chemotaxis protein